MNAELEKLLLLQKFKLFLRKLSQKQIELGDFHENVNVSTTFAKIANLAKEVLYFS